MSSKGAVNTFLTKVSGYHLTKGNPGAAQAEIRRQREKIVAQRAKIKALTDEIQGAKTSAAKPARSAGFPSDFDDETREIIRAVREYTMTGSDKLHALITATRYISRYKIPGDIVECGVWRGGSMQAAARTLLESGDTTRDLYLFDTYEGMPEPGEHDVRHDGKPASELLAAQAKDSTVWAVASLEDVQAGFATVPYPAEKVHFIKGKVEETVPSQVPEQISILRLDTDWYESTAHELTHMWDRLSPGGVLMIDDYGHWKGSRQATDEFLDRTGARLLLVRMNSGRVAVKP